MGAKTIGHLSKKSPFEVTVFVADHWFEILLFVLGSYDRIKPNTKLVFKDAADLSNAINRSLRRVISDIPKIENGRLPELLEWFNSFKEQAAVATKMLSQNRVFQKITKIRFIRNSLN